MRTVRSATVALAAALAVGLSPGGHRALVAQEGPVEGVESVCVDCHPGIEWYRLEALDHADSLRCRSCHHIGFSNDATAVRLHRVELCRDCHEDVYESHAAVGDRAPECTECHSIHGTAELTPDHVAVARCGVCHSEPHTPHAPMAAEAPGCVDCHAVHGEPEGDPQGAATVACAACHDAVHPAHDAGDGLFGAAPGPDGPRGEAVTCSVCHAMDTGFGLGPDLATGCAECHSQEIGAHAGHDAEELECTGCHTLTAPLVGRRGQAAMDRRCGVCHEEAWQALRSGGHAETVGALRSPGCSTCHFIDGVPAGMGDAARRRIGATARCVTCHAEQASLASGEAGSQPAASYEEDFHGQTVLFLAGEEGTLDAGADVLLCSDCHGAHDVHLTDRSEVAPVCERCHEDVGEELAGAWLGHEPPGPRNAVPVWLVRIFYSFLIPFMLVGLFLTIAFHLVDQRRKGARMWQAPGWRRLMGRLRGDGGSTVPTVRRFTRTEQLEHVGSMLTFLLLVVTGLPQTRPDLPIAQGIIDLLGGIWWTRVIHRVVGVAFVALMVTHVVRAVVKALRRRRLPVMLPVRKDFEDIVQTFRHYRGGAPLPKVGKFDFSQKFEYWGLFLGGIVMSGSGLVLLFPELFTQVLPGILIAAIRTMHGLEATFAVLVVVLWHSYGVIFRPEIFPLDTTIFTGRMRLDRLKHEHALEYERLFPDQSPE